MATVSNILLFYLFVSSGCMMRADKDRDLLRLSMDVTSYVFSAMIIIQCVGWFGLQIAALASMRSKPIPVSATPEVVPKDVAVKNKYRDVKAKVEAEKERLKEEEEADKRIEEEEARKKEQEDNRRKELEEDGIDPDAD
mmetsp:Transcript_22179/g.21409  ORF Transcript_22179/g.21409 Transcript_22179/m.21409 type:complete len:139 (+) Transcript_22179:748-1164(+)